MRTVLLPLLLAAGLGCSRSNPGAAPAPSSPAPPAPAPASAGPSRAIAKLGETRGWANAAGGQNGRVVRVTTLAADGPGSLAEALAAAGRRLIVFEIGGVIDLAQTTLTIQEPFVTVAGQTAPSPGITLIKGGLKIKTHDVVIQHLRVRPGEAGMAKQSGWEVDGITTTTGAVDVIVDHCSLSWATDENLSASGERFRGDTPDAWRSATSHRITFSNNIVAEGLSNSTHRKGEHSKGSLIHDNVTDVTVVRNLYASNVERNPFFKGGARGVVVNNVISNPAKYAMKYTLVADEWGDHPHQVGRMSVVGNVFRHGPSTPVDVPLLFSTGPGQCELYAHDNVGRTRSGTDAPLLGGAVENFVRLTSAPTWPPALTPLPSAEVVDRVLADAGARPWDRDAIDRRIVEETRTGGGAIVDSEQQVGGYPAPAETRAIFDPATWDLALSPP